MKIKSIIAIMCITIAGSASAQLKYPATRTDASVIDDYFGMKVADPYRWLEDDNSAETAEWVKAQNAVTGAYLQKIPFRNALKNRLTRLFTYERSGAPFKRNGKYYFYRNDGLQNQAVLYEQATLTSEPVVFLDPNTKTIAVQGVNLSDDISVSVDGEGFSASAELITNSSASKRAAAPLRVDASSVTNADAYIQLTFHGNISANYEGELVLTSGDVVSRVRLTSEALDGLPAAPAENVSDTSFTARWVNVGDEFADGTYRLDVADDNGSIAGYPVYVDAGALTHLVENLQPATHYIFSLTSETMQSNVVEVTTDEAHPAITYVFDPDALVFSAAPNQPSKSTEVLYEVENITGNVTFSVTAPFEVSTDNNDWATSVTAASDASLYVRLGSAAAGEYITSIRVTPASPSP